VFRSDILHQELAENQSSPPPGCKINLENENDILNWTVIMDGPPDSIYAGGHFKIAIKLPKEYPFKPPVLNFKTKIYHPNVTNDENGSMCLGMLRPDEWKPPNKIADVLKLVRTVLAAPQPDDAVEQGIADQFKNNRKEFDKIAKDWTNKHAK
jgi:ubiquitin-protein ligase